MSRILHLVNMSQRYHGSKGVRESTLEEPPWTSLAAPCHLEESASHHTHLLQPWFCSYSPPKMESLKSQTPNSEESASHHI